MDGTKRNNKTKLSQFIIDLIECKTLLNGEHRQASCNKIDD